MLFPVTLEVPAVSDPVAPDAGGAGDAGYASADVAELATLRERVAGLERLVTATAAERDAWRDQAARHEAAAQQLRTLVAQTQQLTRALPAGDGGAVVDRSPAPTRWQRLRRRLGGG